MASTHHPVLHPLVVSSWEPLQHHLPLCNPSSCLWSGASTHHPVLHPSVVSSSCVWPLALTHHPVLPHMVSCWEPLQRHLSLSLVPQTSCFFSLSSFWVLRRRLDSLQTGLELACQHHDHDLWPVLKPLSKTWVPEEPYFFLCLSPFGFQQLYFPGSWTDIFSLWVCRVWRSCLHPRFQPCRQQRKERWSLESLWWLIKCSLAASISTWDSSILETWISRNFTFSYPYGRSIWSYSRNFTFPFLDKIVNFIKEIP